MVKRLIKFTTLPVLFYYIKQRQIPLLNPEHWEDKNDSHTMREYAQAKGFGKVLATCFTTEYETIHHWKSYAPGSAGCAVEFAGTILDSILDDGDYRHGVVDYLKLREAEEVTLEELPFVKRYPYRIEEEYRVIYQGEEDEMALSFRPEQIRRITITQNMPVPVYKANKELLAAQLPASVKISQSTILDSKKWRNTMSEESPPYRSL